jgi:hypothetical protein
MPARVTFRPIVGRGVVVVTLTGDLDGERYVARMLQWYGDRPHLAPWHRIYDLSRYTGSIGHEHVQDLARRLPAGAVTAPAMTVIITPDPFFRVWTLTFPLFAPGRRYAVVTTRDEAWAAIAEGAGD